MSIITLTSDWGLNDHYVGAVKGNILKHMPDACIVDITHSVTPFDLSQAAFVIRNVYRDFPKGTVHIIGINTEESKKISHLVVKAEDQYFISADTGIFSLIFDKKPDLVIELRVFADTGFYTFSARDVFAKVAVHLASGKPAEELGFEIKDFSQELLPFKPVVLENSIIKGHIIYIDAYENLITNIGADLFRTVGQNSPFTIYLRNPSYTLTTIHETYDDVKKEGEMVALFNSGGYLEIALNKGNAAGLLGMEINDPVRIEFDKK
ncbi:MAG: SAM-dependent chlorinase/fluorinase [Lentimicrobiaceae bacterium]|jgi:hypothetical protein|nr:SAM-dependent chlorinase/fluorinase [Lentimicrobiaceae bacterium]